jgi:hypothetical protein
MKRQSEFMAIHADGGTTIVPPPKMSINEAHAKYGHCSEALARKMA